MRVNLATKLLELNPNVLRLYFSCELRNRNFSATTKRNAIRERDDTTKFRN